MYYVSILCSSSARSARTQGQYQFVYETLLEYTRGIDSRFPVSCLAEKIKERGIKDKKTKKNAYQMEYMVRKEEEGIPPPPLHRGLIGRQCDERRTDPPLFV